MKQVYDWDNNKLEFEDTFGNKFNLKFKGYKTIINGESASGKTLIASKLSEIIGDKNIGLKPYEASNVVVINLDNIAKLDKQNGKLIVIDRAELLLDYNLTQYIKEDINNRYLIFCRAPLDIGITPNHYAELVHNNDTFELKYEFNIGGWS